MVVKKEVIRSSVWVLAQRDSRSIQIVGVDVKCEDLNVRNEKMKHLRKKTENDTSNKHQGCNK